MKFKTITTKFMLGDHESTKERLVLEGYDNIIIVEDDCCHQIYDKGEEIEHNQYMGSEYIPPLAYGDLMANLQEKEINLAEWVHCFGIKSRIHGNYKALQNTCREYGISIDFPKWER
jgi:hypothetical protein